MSIEFEWDEKKAITNLKKYSVSFEEASSAFGDTLSITIEDPFYSDEHRLILIGKSLKFNTLVVIHLEQSSTIRIISARKATKKEQIFYEES